MLLPVRGKNGWLGEEMEAPAEGQGMDCPAAEPAATGLGFLGAVAPLGNVHMAEVRSEPGLPSRSGTSSSGCR